MSRHRIVTPVRRGGLHTGFVAPKKPFKPKLAKTPQGAIVEEATSRVRAKTSIDFVRSVRRK
jgi:hypothetical protein